MNRLPKNTPPALWRRGLAACLLLFLLLGAGCTKAAKFARHVKRGDAAYRKGDNETARIEYLNAFRLNPESSHVISQLGVIFFDRGDFSPAAQFLTRAKELEPTNLPVRLRLGTLRAAVGQYSNAVQEAEFVLSKTPADGEALLLLASCAHKTNEIAATRLRFETLAKSQATNGSLQLALGTLYERSRDLKSAEAAYKNAQTLSPTNSKPALALAGLYWQQGNTNAADAEFKTAVNLAPPKSVERLRYADFKFKTGQTAAGKELLEDTIKKAPDFIPALNALAEVALQTKDTNSCATCIQKALALDSNNRGALLNRVRLKMVQGDKSGAMEDLETLGRLYPKDPVVPYQMSLVHLANADNIKAITSLDRAINLNTNYAEAILLRSEVELRRGDTVSAVPPLLSLAKRFPKLTQAQYLLASAYRMRGTPDEALSIYANVAKEFPKDPQPYQLAGVTLRQQKKLPEARKAYEGALAINQDYLPAIDDLIELDIMGGKFDEALARVQTYIEKYPDKPMPRLLQAKILLAQKKNVEAEAALHKAIQLDPEFYAAHKALAEFYIASNQHKQAIAKLEDILKKNPKDAGSLLQIAMLQDASTNYTAARESYEKLLEVNPKSVPALNNLAYLLSERFHDPDRALTLAQTARDLAPYDPFSADTFGWIAFQKGDYNRALGVIQQADEKLPNQPEVQYHLGMAYYMTGSEAQARAALESATKAEASFNGKDKALAALEVLNTSPASGAAGAEALEKRISQNPSDLFAYIRLAENYEARQQWEKARAAFEKALEISPRSAPLMQRLAVLSSDHLNQPARALDLAKQAWGIARNVSSALPLGRVGYAAGDYKWAAATLQEAQRLRSDDPAAAYYLGLALYSLGRVPQAADLFQTASVASSPVPEVSAAQHVLPLLNFERTGGDAAPAAQNAAAFLRTNPAFPPAVIVSAMMEEGKGNPAGARDLYERLLQARPGNLNAQRHLAVLLCDHKMDDAKAAQLASALRVEFSNDPDVNEVLGKLAFRKSDYKEAARFLTQASAVRPNDSDLLYHLGLSQYRMKDKQARQVLTRALALDAKSDLSGPAKAALAELK